MLDKYNPDSPPEFEPGHHRRGSGALGAESIAALKPKVAKLKARFGDTTEDLVAVALNYVLAQPRVACVIPGFRNPRQARCNVQAEGRTLSADDLAFVREALA